MDIRDGSASEEIFDARDTASGDRAGDPAPRSALAALLVPTCLGMLGFFAVAAAVSSTNARVHVTVPGLLLVLAALALAACAPLLLGLLVRGPVRQAVLAGTSAASLLVMVGVLARQVVLFTLPAVPTALIGGAVLLSTSLWGQFRKGAADDPIVDPLSGPPHRSFGMTLLEVLGNWMLFLGAAAIAAWFLLP